MVVIRGVLRENEMEILRRTEKAMMRAICGVKIIEKRQSQELKEFARFKRYFGRTSQGEWSALVWACFEKSIGF